MKLRKVVYCVAVIAAMYAAVVLYSHQLGAVAFLTISLFLFYFAIKELLKQRKGNKYDSPVKNEKSGPGNR